MTDWPRCAEALDLRLAGWPLYAIGDYFGVSKERARQMVIVAERRLAYRVFKQLPRSIWKYNAELKCWQLHRNWDRWHVVPPGN